MTAADEGGGLAELDAVLVEGGAPADGGGGAEEEALGADGDLGRRPPGEAAGSCGSGVWGCSEWRSRLP